MDPMMYYVLELADRYFKTAIITILKDVKEATLKVNRQIGITSKEVEMLIKSQMEILELKNSLVGLKSILETKAERVSKLDNVSVEMI